MNGKNKLRADYGGNLKRHWRWSVLLALTLLILDGVLLWEDRKAGVTALVFTAVYFLVILWLYYFFRPKILKELVNFATRYGQVQKEILQAFEIPAALLEPDGKVLWMNDNMCMLTERKSSFRRSITTLFPQLTRSVLPISEWETDVELDYKDQNLRAHIQRISMDELLEEAELVEKDSEINFLYMVYMFDETQLHRLMQENREQKPAVALIYIDNYEDVMDRTDEVHQSLMNVLVERRISKYIGAVNGLVKKLEKDKYVAIIDRKSLDSLCEDRFSLLDGIKTINIGNEIDMTLSIGVGLSGKDYAENYEFARAAIDMALGRGGDQAVMKDADKISFYGGKTQRSEKSTRVKARVKAQALRDLMLTKDDVVVMGHRMTDMDSLGCAIGVCRAAMTIGKTAHIVIGDQNTNIRGWIQRFRDTNDYPDDLFITHEQAMQRVTNNTLVVVVDTNRPGMTECQEILAMTRSLVVLDHHRTSTDTFEGASLSYIEPSASSACEMIAEILQYFEDGVKLRNLEADCIYAGIIIDTNSFVAKTGVRTFEAAAYLRRSGADVTRVRKALRDDMESYKARANCVSSAEKYMDSYAISICDGGGLENPSVTGAQAANELLNINGVKASFVITKTNDLVFISARSIDELNVQLVMERLGGGGHLNIAGAQLRDVTSAQAVEQVKDVLKKMTEEGAI